MTDLFHALAAPFPRNEVHWRAQNVAKSGEKALALAYIDARDVMRRLDDVCGPANWQDSYVESAKGRVICTISLRIDGEWIAKSDGAGDTAVEGEKGGISDAFKRAAVKWGIGRYLYQMGDVWVPCESGEPDAKGKRYWRKWKADPWQFVRNAPDEPKAAAPKAAPRPAPTPPAEPKTVIGIANEIGAELDEIATQYPGKSEPFYLMVSQLRQINSPADYTSWENKNEQVYLSLTIEERGLIDAECTRQIADIKAATKQAA